MELGLVLPHSGPTAAPEFIRDFAQTAEEVGIDGLWAVDHLVLPRIVASPYVLGRQPVQVAAGWLAEHLSPNYELITTLSWVAGMTRTISLGTSVSVLPIRNPVANARQLASLDALSGGRLWYGAGIGWMREEADVLGLPWDRRGERSEEHIAVLRALWRGNERYVEFHGRFFDFDEVDRRPQPLRGTIPILIGGHSEAALSRAARIGDGWIASPMPPERLTELLSQLRVHRERAKTSDPDFRVVAATNFSDLHTFAASIATYRILAVDHLQVLLPAADTVATIDLIPEIARVGRA
ncbi:TIGR03619 family F420-dependent LLM class oxidoreductase [Mycobacterium sp. 236(2023)]|uniref:TIGR03619 family F420-dependent LLM class oxidoreductase n=1 Tax=Mycobacterium sp. 236(2023) TaxID=3038163 RepID=UPI0024158AAE|nr:TIGR03619 family F420-dependent LLM class oxidoreductase [Mycobacterium sp. 236(2023)]MDG4669245.1 TIGR03619 family F420-dependent LLM class oxidoreductase [Mycobacterium sp. 236(2023)]